MNFPTPVISRADVRFALGVLAALAVLVGFVLSFHIL